MTDDLFLRNRGTVAVITGGTQRPDVTDGARGVSFVESAMRSYTTGGVWTRVEAI